MKMHASISVMALLLGTNAIHAETISQATNNNFGISLSAYRYEEPGFMSLDGGKFGLDINSIKVLQHNRFIRGDLRYAFGTVDYSSYDTGNASGELDLYIEARGLFGKEWAINNTALALYTGLGYRYLFNDGRNISSTGAAGYRRESNYLYAPIGIINRTPIINHAILVSNLEYDHLLIGRQVSKLSDVEQGYSDLVNQQNKGYGLKLSIMYEKGKRMIGPYAHYWNIDDSEITSVFQNGIPSGTGMEPKNNTVEFGLKASQQF